jgi:CheY-like chemotaxis protein
VASDPSPAGVRQALLVEDEALVAMVAEEFLADLGFEALPARTAAEAMQIVESGADLVVALVDVGLPDQRGDELARRMRELKPEMPILIASGYDQGDLKARFTGDAGVGVLGKPYTEADLARALGDLGVRISEA